MRMVMKNTKLGRTISLLVLLYFTIKLVSNTHINDLIIHLRRECGERP